MKQKQSTSVINFMALVIAAILTGACYAIGAIIVFTIFGIKL